MDYAHDLVDARIKKLSKRLQKEYAHALSDLEDKARAYFDKFAEQDEKKREEVRMGKLTQKEYKKWRTNKILYGKRYDDLITELSKDLTHTDEIAQNMINKSVPYAYMDAANYTAYEIETTTLTANFTVYNYDAIAELIQNENMLPQPKVNIPKDMLWNKKNINSAIVQGILQGESIPKIAKRLQNVTDMNRRAAIRNARTLHTAAEAKGRQDCYLRAEEMGIDIAQEWIATLDERTRDAHRELDGVVKPMGEPFENSIGKIRYPADPQAHPANVYNCRCTLRGVLKDYPYQTDRFSKAGYAAWKQGKKK